MSFSVKFAGLALVGRVGTTIEVFRFRHVAEIRANRPLSIPASGDIAMPLSAAAREAFIDAYTKALLATWSSDEYAARLESDLRDGTWEERHGHLLSQTRADYGYRLIIAGG